MGVDMGPKRRAVAGKHAAPAGAASMTQIQQGFIIRRQRADASNAAQRAGAMRGDIRRMSMPGLGLLALARSAATVPKWGKELQPTEHLPAILHGVMEVMGHF